VKDLAVRKNSLKKILGTLYHLPLNYQEGKKIGGRIPTLLFEITQQRKKTKTVINRILNSKRKSHYLIKRKEN
jgi:hypothetical protein